MELERQKYTNLEKEYTKLLYKVDPTAMMPKGYADWDMTRINALLKELKPSCTDGVHEDWNVFHVNPYTALCTNSRGGNKCMGNNMKFYIRCQKCEKYYCTVCAFWKF